MSLINSFPAGGKSMASEDMDEVVTPKPSSYPRKIKYSTDEQVIGEWIDGSTLYQKTIPVTFDTTVTYEFYRGTVTHGIANMAMVCEMRVVALMGTFGTENFKGYYSPGLSSGNTSGTPNVSTAIGCWCNKTTLQIMSNWSICSGNTAYVTILYTKTT